MNSLEILNRESSHKDDELKKSRFKFFLNLFANLLTFEMNFEIKNKRSIIFFDQPTSECFFGIFETFHG